MQKKGTYSRQMRREISRGVGFLTMRRIRGIELAGRGILWVAGIGSALITQQRWCKWFAGMVIILGVVRMLYLRELKVEFYEIKKQKGKKNEKKKGAQMGEADEIKKIRMMHMTDIHNQPKTQKILKIIDKYQPEIVFDTGDALDELTNKRKMGRVVDLYAKILEKGVRIVKIDGNHERSSGWSRRLKCKTEDLVGERGARMINLDGRKSWVEVETRAGKLKIGSEFMGREQKQELDVILVHNPMMVEEREWHGRLILAGHTHGGLVQIFGRAIYCPDQDEKIIYDWGRFEKIMDAQKVEAVGRKMEKVKKKEREAREGMSEQTMLVSKGVGYSTPALRIACPADVGIIDYSL